MITENEVTKVVIECAVKVHKKSGEQLSTNSAVLCDNLCGLCVEKTLSSN